MSRTLTTFLTGAAIAASAAAYEAKADEGAIGGTIAAHAATAARTQTYVPERIDTNEIKQGARSSTEYEISAEPVNINGIDFHMYKNEFAQDDELSFMLALPNDAKGRYSFGTTPEETTGIAQPKKFYIPTRYEVKNEEGEMVPGREFTLKEQVQSGIPFTLETFVYGETEFFRPNAKAESEKTQPFYFIGILPNQENVVRDLSTGEVTIFAEDGDGVWEQGEGIFRPEAVSYSEYLGRKTAFEQSQAEAARQAEEAKRIESEKAEQKRLEELRAPKPGTEGEIRG